MKFDHDADDLLVLARRGDLPPADARRLRDMLARSGEARLLYEAGRAFDREAPVLAGDDERIAAIQRCVEKRMRPSRAGRRAWAVRLCVAAALITGVAGGAIELRGLSFLNPATWMAEHGSEARKPSGPAEPGTTAAPPLGTAEPAPPAEPAPALATPPAPSAFSAPPTATPPPAPRALSAPPTALPRPTLAHDDETTATSPPGAAPNTAGDAASPPPSGAPPTVSSPLSAPELFAAANRARVAGDAARAVSLSRELEERFPQSREAVTTHLSLGLLYLQQGAAAGALREFRQYRAVGDASTMPDALWGECRALRQLGRAAEERTVLAELLDRYPSSAYADAARRRLTELR